jgi:gamma-glutamyltranspeptidase/glutathione hydrolase
MPAQDRSAGLPRPTRSVVLAKNGIAATSHPLATSTALDVLRRGGSAVDAAIAANAVLGVGEPTGCGIGGDLFAIVWDGKHKELTGLNGSGRSPQGLTREWFVEQGYTAIPPYGPLPISVPGCVDAWFLLHERFGRLPIADVLAPAIAYAEQGVPVPRVIAGHWRLAVRARRLRRLPGDPARGERGLRGGLGVAQGRARGGVLGNGRRNGAPR